MLPSKGSKALGHFIEILKEDYEWLAEDLEDAINNQEDVLDSSSTSDNVKNVSRDLPKKQKLNFFYFTIYLNNRQRML